MEIVEGMRAGRRLNVARPIEIGRDPAADLVLDDELVSGRHARISPSGSGVLVEDLDSRNGTFVNGVRVCGPTAVNAGDQVVVGVSVLELRTAQQVAARPSAVHPVPAALATPQRRPDYVTPVMHAEPRDEREHALTPLLDVHTKRMARTAPLAVFVLVALVVIIFLATR